MGERGVWTPFRRLSALPFKKKKMKHFTEGKMTREGRRKGEETERVRESDEGEEHFSCEGDGGK